MLSSPSPRRPILRSCSPVVSTDVIIVSVNLKTSFQSCRSARAFLTSDISSSASRQAFEWRQSWKRVPRARGDPGDWWTCLRCFRKVLPPPPWPPACRALLSSTVSSRRRRTCWPYPFFFFCTSGSLQPRIGLSAANICFNGLLLEYLRYRKAPTGHSPRRRSVTVSATAADLLQPADSRLDDRFLEIFKLMSRL